MKSKASGPKRKSYDNIEFAACKQPKKNKKRFDPSQYNLYNSSHENNETNNKSPKINEEIQAYDAVMITGNGSLAELKKVFYELPYVKPSGNNKKTNAPNENSYNSIDHLMIAYGFFNT